MYKMEFINVLFLAGSIYLFSIQYSAKSSVHDKREG